MQRKVIQKIIDNLKGDKPDLSYILGILETIIESLPEEKPIFSTSNNYIIGNQPLINENKNNFNNDEGASLDATASAKLAEIKRLSQLSL